MKIQTLIFFDKLIKKFIYSLNKYLPKIQLDIHSFINDIKDLNYCIIKYDSPSKCADFPNSYKIGTDIDIIVEKNDILEINKSIKYHFNKSKMMYLYDCIIYNNSDCIKVRIERFGILHYLIEVFIKHRKISNNCIRNMLETKVGLKTFYIPHKKYEILVRLVEYIEYPRKKHHFEYIMENKAFVDDELLKSEKLFESYYQLFK